MLELIDGISKLSGYDVIVMDELKEKYPDRFNSYGGMDYKWFEKEIRDKNFIYVRKDVNSIAFSLKNEKRNGADLSAVISFLIEMIHAEKLKNDDEQKIEKYNKILDNLLFSFKHLKELREVK